MVETSEEPVISINDSIPGDRIGVNVHPCPSFSLLRSQFICIVNFRQSQTGYPPLLNSR